MKTEPKELHEVLENVSPKLQPIADLVEWSLNYQCRSGTPFLAFLDLIGFNKEVYGVRISGEAPKFCAEEFELDYASADSFADSLKVWAVRPGEVFEFCNEVLNAD